MPEHRSDSPPPVSSKPAKAPKRSHEDSKKRRPVQASGSGDDDDNDGGARLGAKPHQIGYYTGEMRTILERAKSLIRVFLATINFFPDPKNTVDVAITCFDEAVRDVLGRRAKRKSSVLFSVIGAWRTLC